MFLSLLKRPFSSANSVKLKNEALLRFQSARLLQSKNSSVSTAANAANDITASATNANATTCLRQPESITALLARRPSNHDLILVDARPTPPIVRFQPHSEAFKAELLRHEAQTRARLANKLKELHLSTATSEHDLHVKLERAREWLQRGWRVRVQVEQKRRRGNSNATIDGKVDERRLVMATMMEQLEGVSEQSGQVEQERGNLIFTLGPTQKVLTQLKRERSSKEDEKK